MQEPGAVTRPIYQYRPDVLEALLRHGVRPTPATHPDKVRGLVRELYKFEIRKLRDRVVSGDIAKRDYARCVDELRRRYPVLSLQAWQFVIDGTPPAGSIS